MAFARYDGSNYLSQYNDKYNDNAYAGFMYGTPGASTYAETHANTNLSTIYDNLFTWFINLYSIDAFGEEQLADTIWCNAKSVVTVVSFDPWGMEPSDTNFGYGKNTNYYSVTERLVSSNNKAGGTGPSLICPNDNNGGKLSKFTSDDTEYGNGELPKKVGLLTTDEVAFAGGAFLLQNSTYYLNKNDNTEAYNWWLLSPLCLSNAHAYISAVWSKKSVIRESLSEKDGAISTSLSLVSNIKTSSGDGTATIPYKVITE